MPSAGLLGRGLLSSGDFVGTAAFPSGLLKSWHIGKVGC